VATEHAGQRVHADDQDEREEDRSQDRGELLQRKRRDEQTGDREDNDESRGSGPLPVGAGVVIQRCPRLRSRTSWESLVHRHTATQDMRLGHQPGRRLTI